MNIKDITNAASEEGLSQSFLIALETVLPDECVFESDAITIRKEMPDNRGWTFAGLNQKDDGLSVDGSGNVTSTPQWIAIHYFNSYWDVCHCESLPYPLSILVFVQAVNQGNGEAIIILQLALNDYDSHLTVDGKIGDATTKAVRDVSNYNGLCLSFLETSGDRYKQIVSKNPSESKNLTGWLNRISGLEFEFCKKGIVASIPQESSQNDGLVVTSDIINI